MIINQAIIHELVKKAGVQDTSTKPAENLLKVDDVVLHLVSELNKLYGTKGNNSIYGTFSRKNITNQFPDYTDDYLKSETGEKFLALSLRCMAELEREASALQSSTGGYIVFARYKEDQGDFLLIAMIKDKQGLQVNEKLEPISVTSIDLSKIHQAARINLNLYKAVPSKHKDENEDDDVVDTKAYLSFVSPRTNHDVSGYFIKALDCADGVPSARATKIAFTVVDEYFQSILELKPFRPKARDCLIEYLKCCLEVGDPASLAGIEHAIGRAVPLEKHESVKGFSEFANSDQYQLPETFGVNAAKLKGYTRIKAKTENWELSFSRKAVGIDENSELFYHKESGTLTIKCSDELTKQIETAINDATHESQ